jgi:hypothetical protein
MYLHEPAVAGMEAPIGSCCGGSGKAAARFGKATAGARIPPELAALRSALLSRLTTSDVHWLSVPLRGGFTIDVCSPICVRATAQELQPVAAYLDGPVPANGLYLYVPVTADESSAFALKWGVFPLTRAVSDQAHNAAVFVPKPPWPPAADRARRMYDFVGYSQKIQTKYFSYQGWSLVSGAHKVWALSARGPVVNHGFHATLATCRSIPGLACVPGPLLDKRFAAIQDLGARHDARHWDYSQMLQFMRGLRDDSRQTVDLSGALLSRHPAVWDEPAKLPEAHLPNAAKGARAGARVYGLGWFAEVPPPPRTVIDLIPFSQPQTQATVANALSIVRLISQFQGIPWRLPFVILEHEGGIRAFRHQDGVMQVTDVAKPRAIQTMPHALKLVLTGRALTDQIATTGLNAAVRTEFPRRLAVQIACGIQLLKNALDRFAGYVALAYIAYNSGDGNAARVVTGGRNTNRPRGTTDEQWESLCRFAASLYHQFPRDVRIATGQWQCDANIPAWFQRFAVFDQHSGQPLIAYHYLRGVQSCIRPVRPTIPCTRAVHGQRQDGTGNVACNATRAGALDKLYNPAQLSQQYRDAIATLLVPIPEDKLPIKVVNGRMVKMPLASGPVAPRGNPFEGIDNYAAN